MTKVLIVGDGPAGLSAALFLAKNGVDTTVVGRDKTAMHKAMLWNYLGIPEMTGSDFQRLSREQASAQGARILDAEVTAAERAGSGFAVVTDGGERLEGDYLILAIGPKRELAESLGLEVGPRQGIEADRDGRTAVDRLYAAGWAVRPARVQAIISAGDGAAAALSILSAETGKEFHDFDVVEK